MTTILRDFAPIDAEHRRLLWGARAFAAQLQCATSADAVLGRANLQQIRVEISRE